MAIAGIAFAGCYYEPEETTVTPTGVTVSPPVVSLAPGSTQQLTATVTPDEAANKKVTWSSGNTARATVSADGLVTIPANATNGDVTITATTVDGGKTANCTITVTNVIVPPTGIIISPSGDVSVEVGKTTTLSATVEPSNATNKNITWNSLNPDIATVNAQTGVVTGVKAGLTDIRADCSGVSATKSVTVTNTQSGGKATESIIISPSGDMTVEMGRTVILTATVTPDDAANKNVTWSSDNISIAIVNEAGVVTGISEGTTIIRATAADGSGITADKSVTVIPSLPMTGSGTPEDPYIIRTPTHLDNVRNNLSAHYKLGNNIDLSGYLAYGGVGYSKWSSSGWQPIGTFTGSLDGADFKISGLWISRSAFNTLGLFSFLGNGGSVKNLGIEIDAVGINATNNSTGGNDNPTAGLVGRMDNGSITNCYVIGGAINGGGWSVGGILGTAWSGSKNSITNCYSDVAISGRGTTGGVAGSIYECSITNCYSTGAIKCSGSSAGGVVGSLSINSIMSNCYATGSVSSSSAIFGLGGEAGGVVGFVSSGSIINNCYFTGAVSGNNCIGGIAGTVTRLLTSDAPNSITNCYSSGNVSSIGDYVGGVVGYVGEKSGVIINCVSLSASVTSSKNTVHIGRVAGFVFDFNMLENNFAQSNMTTTANGVNKTLIKAGNMLDGADCAATPATNWWTTAAPNGPGWSSSIWNLASGQLPKLR